MKKQKKEALYKNQDKQRKLPVCLIGQIEIWRRFLFMKKGRNKSILFYVVSVLFYIVSAIGFMRGNDNSMALVWSSLGCLFLCLGSTHKKKENNKTNTDDK